MVLYALIVDNARAAKKRAVNLLIINQNLLDFACCLLLVLSFCISSSNDAYLTGWFGYLLCAIFGTYTATQCALYGSVFNLVEVTVERYLKVVHPFWSRKYLSRRVIHAAIGFAWIAGMLFVVPVSITSSRVEDGICTAEFQSKAVELIYGIAGVVVWFLFPLVVFIYCYGRMVVVMRRQMRVMGAHGAEDSAQMNASQAQSKRAKWNIIKTMITYSLSRRRLKTI